ncbi:MAG TPA: tRNA (guanosine(46)-N7)-methyltransferase TrmB [Geminicoccaceae bacterium]|nr:tRNA (guanosine(46)-N7)-methyltransferase TrmB [Geminicoccaceae bacterium]
MGAARPGRRAPAPLQLSDRSAPGPPGQPERRQLYGRKRGPRLRPGRQRLLETRLPELVIHLPASGRLDPGSLFAPPVSAVWLEIGFGGGEHLAALATERPEVGFIGVEPFINGVARLLALADAARLQNIRLLVDDARLLLRVLPAASIERVFVLFPDPWPKLRQHKRRIVNPATVAEFARIVVPGGEVRLATDDADYARHMLWTMQGDGRFAWLAERAADWRERPPDWPPTRYEQKALAAGRAAVYLRFERVAG